MNIFTGRSRSIGRTSSPRDPAAQFGAAQRTCTISIRTCRSTTTLERQIDRSVLVERFIATLSTAFAVVAIVALAAGCAPARRATRVNPALALR